MLLCSVSRHGLAKTSFFTIAVIFPVSSTPTLPFPVWNIAENYLFCAKIFYLTFLVSRQQSASRRPRRTHCQANVIYKPNHAKNQLEGLVVFHFSCQQIYSWFFHKQNRSEWVNNKILCSLIYNYLYFQKEWIFFVHLQIRQLRL